MRLSSLNRGTALGGTLSSYTWICMIINFLQTRNPPVLPSLHRRPHQCLVGPDGKLSAFADDIASLRGYGKGNKETIGELLFHFFRRYAHEIDYEKSVISIREGQLISKEAKRWHLMQNNRLCVEEPFNIERNLGNTADDISFRGVHLELRRAFDMIAEAKLEECCEQFVFPATEEKIWEKPPPQPRPVLSRSASQTGRGGKGGAMNNRGGSRHSNPHRMWQSNRRASSGAAFNKPGALPSGINGDSKQEYLDEQFPHVQIHNQLFQHYQLLQAQEAQLRLVLHQRAHQQLQAHAAAQVQSSSHPQQVSLDEIRRQGTIDAAPLSAPLRNIPLYYPMYFTPPVTRATTSRPQQSIHTNPSSPSMTPLQTMQPELRRSLHRRPFEKNPGAAAMRSHSQPARPSPYDRSQMWQAAALGFTTVENHSHGQPPHLPSEDSYQPSIRVGGGSQLPPSIVDSPVDDSVPKEYVGYYVHDSPPPRSIAHVSVVAPIPPYNSLPHRMRGVSPSLTRQKHNSRSSSPSRSSPQRERSQSFYSAASLSSSFQKGKGLTSTAGPRRSGPIIVDGSSEGATSEYATPPEFLCYPQATSEAASLSDDQPINTPVSTSVTPSQEPPDAFDLDSALPSGQISLFSGIPQFGDFPRNITTQSIAGPNSRLEEKKSTEDRGSTRSSEYGRAAVPHSLGLGIGYEESFSTDRRSSAERLPAEQLPSGRNNEQKFSLTGDKLDLRHEKPLLPIPLLSPVREVRTPSPTTSRKEDGILGVHTKASHFKSSSLSGKESMASPAFSASTGKQRDAEPLGQKTNGQPINGILKTSPIPQSNSWQQPSKKAKKKTKANASIGTSSTTAEPLPVDGAERKGG